MAYPIKFRFRNKDTNEIVADKSSMVVLNMQGQPFSTSNDGYYNSIDKLSSKDYILEVALEKDLNGKWIYQQVGH